MCHPTWKSAWAEQSPDSCNSLKVQFMDPTQQQTLFLFFFHFWTKWKNQTKPLPAQVGSLKPRAEPVALAGRENRGSGAGGVSRPQSRLPSQWRWNLPHRYSALLGSLQHQRHQIRPNRINHISQRQQKADLPFKKRHTHIHAPKPMLKELPWFKSCFQI